MKYEKFLEICREANDLVYEAKRKDPTLTGHSPISLKAAAIHYLAQTKSLPITLHQLFLIYGVGDSTIIKNRKKLEKALGDDDHE